MALSNDLISQFVRATNDTKDEPKESTVYGTVVKKDGKDYVKFDGSELLTPVSSTASIKDGERVIVTIKDHSATVTGNVSSPSASDKDVQEIGSKITEFEVVIADKVSTAELEAEKARIDDLIAENVTIKGTLEANEAKIGELEAENVTITGRLDANEAAIDDLEAKKLSADIADIKYASIDDLKATNATVHNLEADYGDFKTVTADTLTAQDATIKNLEAEKLSAKDADLKYANIDFSNIGIAAIEKFYSESGVIKDIIVDDGHITGELVGVTIKGDLIEGNTIVADKLVVKGEDGLYYKLNTDGITTEAEQTDYNSLNGSVIRAKSITATKIAVEDLVAFDATIGGFNITKDSIYSGVKASVDNTTRGLYMDKTGQMAFGDASSFIKYYKDTDGVYKLAISAGTITMLSTNKTVEDAMADMIVSNVDEFYQSTSPSSLIGGVWSTEVPDWEEGKYIWKRSAITYGDGSSEYSPSSTGVCITGNSGGKGEKGEKGEKGDKGDKGEDAILLVINSSNGNIFKNSDIATTLTVSIIVGDTVIECYDDLISMFGNDAALHWGCRRVGETGFTAIPDSDTRLSDHGFIFTLQATDIDQRAVFNCELSY